jgi:prepilin-type N-terminal cleavage/methylation domain-containing protein
MRLTDRNTDGRKARRGFTLTELLVTIMIFGLVVTPIIIVLGRQQRFYRSTSDIIEARTSVRQAIEMLPVDLRSLSTSDVYNKTDLYVSSDKTIEFRAMIGTSVVCRVNTVVKILVPPADMETALTTWIARPVAGDSVLIYDDSTMVGGDEDHWKAYAITGVQQVPASSSGACPTTTGLVTAADVAANRASYLLTLATGVTPSIAPGAPMRFFHTRRYELYQPAGSTSWYLGTFDCRASCDPIAALSGPYGAYSTDAATSGLRFTYLDSLGAEINPSNTAERAKIWRIKLSARADTRGTVAIPGKPAAIARDSISLDIALRNRK